MKAVNTKKLVYKASGKRMDQTERTFLQEFRNGNIPGAEAGRLSASAAHSCTGMAFWPRLLLPGKGEADEYTIDSRRHPDGGGQRSHWQTVLPIMGSMPAKGLRDGDRIEVTCEFLTPGEVSATPKYSVNADIYASG